jgi:uncharacterized protein
LPLLSDPLFWLAATVAVTFLGLAKGGFTGAGAISTPLLALLVPPLQAVVILQPIMLLMDAMSVYVYRRNWSGWNLKVMVPGALLGIAAAGFLAAYVSDAFVRLMVGLIALAFLLNTWFGKAPTEPRKPTAVSGIFWGGVSAFTSTMAHAGGPPYFVHVLPQKLDKLTFVGTTTIFFAIVNAVKTVPYLALGQMTAENLLISGALVPVAIASNLLGFWLVRRVPTKLFFRIAYVFVFVISLFLIRQGIVGLWPA